MRAHSASTPLDRFRATDEREMEVGGGRVRLLWSIRKMRYRKQNETRVKA
jgi:hypothetical protein